MQGGINLNIYKRRSIHTICGSPRSYFHQFKMQLRGIEGHKLQFTTWILLFKTPGGPSPYKKLGRSSLYDWFDEKGELQANYK